MYKIKTAYQLVIFFITFFLHANYCCSSIITLNEDPFFRAVQVGSIDDVRTFVKNGSNVNQIDENGSTPLQFAAAWGHVNVVELLIKEGANVNHRSENGYTALDVASGWIGNIETVKLLIENGANMNGKSHYDYTPLHRASQFGYVEIVSLLITMEPKLILKTLTVIPLTK